MNFPKLVLHCKIISGFLKRLVNRGNSCHCFVGLSDIYTFVHSVPLSTHPQRTEEERRACHSYSKEIDYKAMAPGPIATS